MKTTDKVYRDYMVWRALGLRAVVALGVARYGFSFLLDLLIDEEN